ncbi:MAG: SIMPL domain-containing protein [Flavobacteriales bacterium]|nr:SIMPL domain-containing protein [Flavobacteriales bacterium]
MKTTNAILFAAAIVLAALFLGNAYVERAEQTGTISVTGLGSEDFVSDLIVWEGRFVRENSDLKAAYAALEQDKSIIREYLVSKGLKPEQVVFKAVSTAEQSEPQYQNGNYIGAKFVGYQLTQAVEIESRDVAKVEELSRSITELMNKGVQFYSNPPRYYYTKMADLKIEMIRKATEDARLRAETIAANSGGELGDLQIATMGVFQITGQNSNEDYSWGGAFNTADKNKTASITMRLVYEVED